MLAIPIVKPLVKPLAKPVVVSGILTYVKGGLVLDLTRAFNEDSTTINDRSPESNDATLYSGRYASTNGVSGKLFYSTPDLSGIDLTAAGAVSQITFKGRAATGTVFTFNLASGVTVTSTQVGNNVWEDHTITVANVTVNNFYAYTSGASADWSNVKVTGATASPRYQLNESRDASLDGYPAIDSSGNGYHGTHSSGVAGGATAETTILQTAGMDWNKYRTLTDGVSTGFSTATPNFPEGGLALALTIGTGFYAIPIPSGVLGNIVTVEGNITIISGSPAFSLRTGTGSSTTNSNVETVSASGTFSVTLTATGSFSYLTISEADVPANYTFAGLRISYSGNNYLIPASDSTPSNDALGNAIAIPRPTSDTFNGFSSTEYLGLPDNASLETVRSITVAIYNDGTTRDFVQAAGGSSFVHSASNVLTTDQTGTHAYYVNGVATTTLAAGWNIVGITFDAAKDLSGGKCLFQNAKLLSYDPTALAADQQLQNFNAFKSKFGL